MKKNFLLILLATTTAILNTNANTLQNEVLIANIIEEFKKIDPAELPPAIVQALIKDYPTSKLGQAFKNKQGKYKLIMVLKSGIKRTVYIDSYGRWLKG